MKKLFYLFLLLPFSMLVSCSDKDFSPVDLKLTLSNVTHYDGAFYVVQGDDFSIDGFTANAIDGTPTTVTNVNYYFNGILLNGPHGFPFDNTISTGNLPTGTYTVSLAGDLLQEEQPIKIFAADYLVKIVAEVENIPAGAPEKGTYSLSISTK